MAEPKGRGRDLLRRFMSANDLTKKAVADGVGVSATSVYFWLRDEKPLIPSLEAGVALERWTNGAVPASSWVPSCDVTPFRAGR